MSVRQDDIVAGCFWYPYRPWLRWPIRVLGAVGIAAVVTKLVTHHQLSDVTGLLGPLWLFLVTFDEPEPRPKARGYLVAAGLAWLAGVFTLLVIGLWIMAQ